MLLIRHAGLQVIILTLRVLQAILALLHVLPLVSAQSLHRDVDQAVRAGTGVVARELPPHGAAEASVLDVIDLLARDLRIVVRDHGAGCGVVGPGRDGLVIVVDLGVGLGEGLEVSLLVGVNKMVVD